MNDKVRKWLLSGLQRDIKSYHEALKDDNLPSVERRFVQKELAISFNTLRGLTEPPVQDDDTQPIVIPDNAA